MVALARESRGLSQSELAKLLSVSQGYISKVESDLLEPNPEMLERLAHALDYPETFFTLSDPVYGPGVTEFWHRKRQAATARQMRVIYAEINKRIIHIERLLRAVELPEAFHRFDLEEFAGPAEIARAVRGQWHLPPGPVENLIGAVEDAGGVVVRCNFGTRLVDAVSRWVPGLPPLFFLNESLPADRERLTLAHEIGHIVMHRAPSPTMEDEAFEFAGELLTPEKQIAPYLAGLTLPRLAALKPAWRVSMASLITRASRLDVIAPRQATYLWMQMGRAGYREREPAELDFPKEEPRVLRELFEIHRAELSYSIDDLASLLAIHPREIERIYPVQRTVEERRSLLRPV
jgi:Zn-dependent peptidase ImmA (M78 family)/transcriptional regulator with XRE-family HTH domain